MEESWLANLRAWVKDQPAVVARLSQEEAAQLSESRRGLTEFTMARNHTFFERLKIPTLCLVFGELRGFRARERFRDQACLAGIVSSKARISSFETRVKITRTLRLADMTPGEMAFLLEGTVHRRELERRLEPEGSFVLLSPEMSSVLVSRLALGENNADVLKTVATGLRRTRRFSNVYALQEDAIQTALRAFGLESDTGATELDLQQGRASAIASVPVREDTVIEHDARSVTGYTLARSDVTGRALFEKPSGQLEVITANRQALEETFGVDLIYLNMTRRNLIMVQYKMLERSGSGENADWIYRPDGNLTSEIARMDVFANAGSGTSHEYRLNRDVFYLKFVKRNGLLASGSIVTPLEHFKRIIASPEAAGPNGGVRLSYDSLEGAYMRQGTFTDLLQAGLIGSQSADTAQFERLIDAVLSGNRSIVAAVQRSILSKSQDFQPRLRYAR